VQYEVFFWNSDLILHVSQANLGSRHIQRAVFNLMIFALDHTYLSLHLDRDIDIP
jgi:hypothetical protein